MPKYLNSFKSPDHREESIVDESGNAVGTIRIKPSSVMWKPKGKQEFYSVRLDAFVDWIMSDASGSKKVSK